MDKRKLLVVLLFTVFMVSLVRFNIPTVKAQGTITETFTSQSYDGAIYYISTSYTEAHNSATGTVADAATCLKIGQIYHTATSKYDIRRDFVFFDTSTIPDDASVTGVKISLYVEHDNSNTDFNVTVQNGQPYYPHKPLASGDYYYSHYSSNGGNRSTSEISGAGYWNITLNGLGISWINVNGTTKLCLRSSRDINSNSSFPEYYEFVDFHAYEKGLNYAPKLYVTYEAYQYTFHGLYNEDSGLLKTESERAVNVTAYYTDETSETFEVNGTYAYNTSYIPLFFHVELGSKDREYWLSEEEVNINIYLFNATFTSYNIIFLDLAGVLNDCPLVEAQRLINGTLMTVEKRKVDVENKISMSLINGVKYNIIIRDGASYVFGDLLMTSTTTVQLTLKGIAFPKETLLTYKYVRIYATRVFDTPNGVITITYQDTLNMTASVKIYINYKNGTNIYYAEETTNSFNHEWSNALNNTDYAVVCTIDHGKYGVYSWKQYLPQHLSSMPWGLDWLGTSLPFNTAYIIPAILILFVGGCFSQINAYVGAFLMVITAIIIAYMGWLPIPGSVLVVALTFAILMGVIYAKRKVTT